MNTHETTAGASVQLVSQADFPTRYGSFRILGFRCEPSGEPFVVLTCGDLRGGETPLLRIHSQCLTGDALGSLRCDCGFQLQEALRQIQVRGLGLLIYQMQEGRGIGIMNKLMTYEIQDSGADTVEANHLLGFEADLRQYEGCAAILHHLGVKRVDFLSNNPAKVEALQRSGIEVAARIPLEIQPDKNSSGYLRTKKEKLGHLLENV